MEYFDIVDENGKPSGAVISRREAHEKGIWHRTSHLWIVRKKGDTDQILLQKRAQNKDSFPGCWDTSSAGHIPAGQEPVESAVRELKEELGLDAAEGDLKPIGTLKISFDMVFHDQPFRDREFVNIYVLEKNVDLKDITVQKEEIDTVDWFDFDTVYQAAIKHDAHFCVMQESLDLLAKALHHERKENRK